MTARHADSRSDRGPSKSSSSIKSLISSAVPACAEAVISALMQALIAAPPDPKKATGILNNPLYVGRLVWGRRQWHRNPDSEKRERRYRLRDRSEWVEVAVPSLRIIDDALWDAAQSQIERRLRPSAGVPVGAQNRKKHLLSGLIRCSCYGSDYTLSGKDYYRCAGQTCTNTVSVRRAPLETATLSIL